MSGSMQRLREICRTGPAKKVSSASQRDHLALEVKVLALKADLDEKVSWASGLSLGVAGALLLYWRITTDADDTYLRKRDLPTAPTNKVLDAIREDVVAENHRNQQQLHELRRECITKRSLRHILQDSERVSCVHILLASVPRYPVPPAFGRCIALRSQFI